MKVSWSTAAAAEVSPLGAVISSPLVVAARKLTATVPLMTVSLVTSMVYMALEAVEPAVKMSFQLFRSTPRAS